MREQGKERRKRKEGEGRDEERKKRETEREGEIEGEIEGVFLFPLIPPRELRERERERCEFLQSKKRKNLFLLLEFFNFHLSSLSSFIYLFLSTSITMHRALSHKQAHSSSSRGFCHQVRERTRDG